MKKITIQDKFDSFHDHWSPKIIADLNGQQVKVAKLLGDFPWHNHPEEDEMFWVIHGELELHFRDQVLTLGAGEAVVVPRGVDHRPVAREEVHVILFEPASTLNTGDQVSERTLHQLERI